MFGDWLKARDDDGADSNGKIGRPIDEPDDREGETWGGTGPDGKVGGGVREELREGEIENRPSPTGGCDTGADGLA